MNRRYIWIIILITFIAMGIGCSNADLMKSTKVKNTMQEVIVESIKNPETQKLIVDTIIKSKEGKKAMAEMLSSPEGKKAMVQIMKSKEMSDTFRQFINNPVIKKDIRDAVISSLF